MNKVWGDLDVFSHSIWNYHCFMCLFRNKETKASVIVSTVFRNLWLLIYQNINGSITILGDGPIYFRSKIIEAQEIIVVSEMIVFERRS